MNPSRVWFLSLLVAGSAAAAGCHDLELAQLRCSLDGRCPPDYACGGDGFCRRQLGDNGRVAGPPGSKKQGEACAAADECITHNCADGVCCDTACGDACRACNLPENVGSCVAIARGQPSVHGGCAQQPATSCGTNGLCDGAGRVPALRRHHGLRRRSLREGQQHLLPRGALRRSRVLRRRRRRTVVRAVHVQAGRQGLRRPLRRPDRVRVAQPLQQRIVRHDRQRPALPQRRPVPVGLLCRRRLLQRTLHGTVHGMRSDRVARNLCAGRRRETRTARAAPAPARERAAPDSARAASATACSYPGGESICRSATCTNGAANASQTTAAGCDGAGSCSAGAVTACGIYMCAAGGVCATTCAGDFDCAAGYICQGGACQAKGAAAAPCTATSQCAGGLTCKDGVCCESACADPCRTLQSRRTSRALRGRRLGRRSGFLSRRYAHLQRGRSLHAQGSSRPARPPPTARAERARPSIQTLTATRSAIAARPSPTARRSRSAAPPARAG